MAIKFNKFPYFDDYSEDDLVYQLLFQPGRAVQARELTTMQSVLQNQIEDMGNHFFKEGAKVIPGGSQFKDQFFLYNVSFVYYSKIKISTFNLKFKNSENKHIVPQPCMFISIQINQP